MKKWLFLFLLFVSCIIFFIVFKRYDAWFGQAKEEILRPIINPDRIQLTFGNKGGFSRIITWQNDELENSYISLIQSGKTDTLYIPAEGRLFQKGDLKIAFYEVEIDSLAIGNYEYSVCSGEKHSDLYQFNVGNPNDDFSFVYIGDIQDTINGASNFFLKDIYNKYPDVDFWVFGGDMIGYPVDQYWSEYFRSMDSISQNIPVVAVPGNHEYTKGLLRSVEERFPYTYSYFIKSQYKGNMVYSLYYGNMVMFTLDSNRYPHSLFEQRRWLKNELKKSEHVKWKVLALHHPVYSIRSKMNNLFIRVLFGSLIKKYGINLVLQGHEHGYARSINKGTKNVYLVSNFSIKDYSLNFSERYDRYGSGCRFYEIVKVHGDTLSIQTFTEEHELYDKFDIVKDERNIQVLDYMENIPERIEINERRIKITGTEKLRYEEEIKERLNR